MTYLRLGIVGYGAVARLHAAAVRAIPSARLTAVLGPDPTRGAAMADSRRVQVTDDLDTFAELVDAAVIASPTARHVEQSIALLERGRSVLVELPVADTLKAGLSIERTAVASNAAAFGAHTARFLPATVVIRDVIRSGAVGVVEAVSIDRRVATRERSWRDDPLLHHGQHAIDVLRAWFGDLSVREADIEAAMAAFVLQLPEGGHATVRVTHAARVDGMRVHVQGTAGELCSDGFGSLEGAVGILPTDWVDIDPTSAYRFAVQAQDSALVEALSGEERAYPSFSETLANLAVVDTIRRVAGAR